LTWNDNGSIISVEIDEAIWKRRVAALGDNEHDPDVIWPDSILQLALFIGIKLLVEISCAHCNLGGNSISIYPFTGILLVGVILTIIGAVVLTYPGLKLTTQLLKKSLISVTAELVESAEISLPITTINESVVNALDGFVILFI